jgi:hypothetical protein
MEVACVDQDWKKIGRLEAGELPIYEPGLVSWSLATGRRLSFTTISGRRSPAPRRCSSRSARGLVGRNLEICISGASGLRAGHPTALFAVFPCGP